MLWLDWLVDAAKRPGEGFGEFSWTLPKGELVAGHKVPHLRWSQAPPLPWLRPGSADMLLVNTDLSETISTDSHFLETLVVAIP